MATSTRKKAVDLWQTAIPDGNRQKLANILFCCENSPGSSYVSGSQDAYGIVLPGLNYLWYNGGFLPERVESNQQEQILAWLESHLQLITLSPRADGMDVTARANLTVEKVQVLASSAEQLWQAVLQQDLAKFAENMTSSFAAQVELYPNMMTKTVKEAIENLPDSVLGYKLCGAGGGGYLAVVTEQPLANALNIRIRRD